MSKRSANVVSFLLQKQSFFTVRQHRIIRVFFPSTVLGFHVYLDVNSTACLIRVQLTFTVRDSRSFDMVICDIIASWFSNKWSLHLRKTHLTIKLPLLLTFFNSFDSFSIAGMVTIYVSIFSIKDIRTKEEMTWDMGNVCCECAFHSCACVLCSTYLSLDRVLQK